MNTLLLDIGIWDLVADANGNIAMATEPYSLAQDVASACRTVLAEVWYDTTLGILYLPSTNQGAILGRNPPLAVLQARLVAAALTVPDVVSATAVIQSFNSTTRTVTGQVQFTDVNGNTGTVAL
jgi:hypothetical protein